MCSTREGAPPCSGPDMRADRAGQRRGDVGAGGGDDPGGEGGGVHAVLGGGDQVGVDGLDVPRVGLAAPADHEPLDDRLCALSIRSCGTIGRPRPRADWATKDSAITEARARSSRACSSSMSSSWPQAPGRGEHGQRALHVDPDVAGVHRDRERLGRRQAGVELVVDQQAPDVAEGHVPDEVLDVDAAVAQRAAFLVRLGDLGLEGDDALEAGLEVGHLRLLASPCRVT